MPEFKDEVYYTRDYQPGDETTITAMFGAVFDQVLTEAHWRWKYAGAGLTPPIARLAFDDSGRLVGHAGALPLRGWRQGRPLPFFQICDVMVHPDARGQLGGRNLFTRLARELLSGLAGRWPEAFAYGFPGRRPFRLGEYVRVYGAIEPAQSLHRPAHKLLLPLPGTQSLDWDDVRLDALWTRLAPNLPLTVVRDRTYLRWRYAAHPRYRYQLLGLHLARRLFGWAVIQQDETRLWVIDLLVARRWLKLALRALERMAGTLGLTEVEIWLPASWRDRLDSLIESTEIIVTHMVWRPSLPTATVREELYYTMGDLDIF